MTQVATTTGSSPISMPHHGLASDHDHDDTILSLKWAFLGIAFLFNSFLLEKIFHQDDAALFSGLAGALILTVPIVIKAIKDLMAGHHHMNELVAIAVLSCLTLDDYRTAGIVAFFMIMADLVEHKTASGAKQAIEKLLLLTPDKALKLENGIELEVNVTDLLIGDVIRVRPGGQIATDGIIIKGNSAVNQANITGESFPVDKDQDDLVYAGTMNLSGLLDIKVTKIGEQTALGKVKELILKAQSTRLPIMTIIDKYIGWYTPIVLLIAVLVYFATHKMEPAITILILSCPCSLILATPTAMIAALSAASRVGILIKDVRDFERAANITSLVFDKTGTLTTGQLSVTRMMPANGVDPAEFLKLAASVEAGSSHPAAKAIVDIAKTARIALYSVDNTTEVPGRGVKAKIDGKTVLVGRKTWLESEGVVCEMMAEDGLSVIYVAVEGKEQGWIGLEDKTRQEAINAVNSLRKMGIHKISLFTGDRLSVAEKVSRELGCDETLAECLPDEKLSYVNDLKALGETVAVVGDGVNDAAALAAGDLGIAMASGSDIAIGSASVAMLSTDLNKLPFLLKLSRKTKAVVYQNFLFGFMFMFIVGTFAIMEYVNPILAGVLHFFSSFIVIFNSFRLVKMGEEFLPYAPKENLK